MRQLSPRRLEHPPASSKVSRRGLRPSSRKASISLLKGFLGGSDGLEMKYFKGSYCDSRQLVMLHLCALLV